MLKTAVTCGSPVSLRYQRGTGVGVPMDDEPESLPIGKGEILRDPPNAALTIVAIGACVHPSLAAAERAGGRGNLRSGSSTPGS